MPRNSIGEAQAKEWMIAAINSIEMITVPWWFLELSSEEDNGLVDWTVRRLDLLEKVLNEQE